MNNATTIRILAWVFNPLHLIVWILYFHVYQNIFELHTCEQDIRTNYFISFGLNIWFFPMILTLLSKQLGFIQSLHLRTNKDRIIPFLGIMIFSFWAWRVAQQSTCLHPLVIQFLFGIFLAFIIMTLLNAFIKFSLYACGIGIVVHFLISNITLNVVLDMLSIFVILTFLLIQILYINRQCSRNEIIIGLIIGFIAQSFTLFIF